jgi:hypothetical protein
MPGEIDAEYTRYNAPYMAATARSNEARAAGGAKAGP